MTNSDMAYRLISRQPFILLLPFIPFPSPCSKVIYSRVINSRVINSRVINSRVINSRADYSTAISWCKAA